MGDSSWLTILTAAMERVVICCDTRGQFEVSAYDNDLLSNSIDCISLVSMIDIKYIGCMIAVANLVLSVVKVADYHLNQQHHTFPKDKHPLQCNANE